MYYYYSHITLNCDYKILCTISDKQTFLDPTNFMRRSENFTLDSVRLDQEIKSMLPDLIVICGPCYVNKRLNTRPVLSKRDSVYFFLRLSRCFSLECIVYEWTSRIT